MFNLIQFLISHFIHSLIDPAPIKIHARHWGYDGKQSKYGPCPYGAHLKGRLDYKLPQWLYVYCLSGPQRKGQGQWACWVGVTGESLQRTGLLTWAVDGICIPMWHRASWDQQAPEAFTAHPNFSETSAWFLYCVLGNWDRKASEIYAVGVALASRGERGAEPGMDGAFGTVLGTPAHSLL